MSRSRTITLAVLLAVFAAATPPPAAQRSVPGTEQGHVGVGLALRRLATAGTFMMAVAHPDDENNSLLVMLGRGQGVRTTLVSATRGEGGQNEIGPELFEALGLLRTGELEALHRYDGTEQYFARAIDFGYSFSLEETFDLWGREEILADFVRLIRTIRPDVVVAMRPEGAGGGQHHQASARIVSEAFRAAADAARFPDQVKAGLRPWQAAKLYHMEGFGGRGGAPPAAENVVAVNTEVWDPLLGETYASIGSVARSQHKSQGMGQLLALPGPAGARYRLAERTTGATGPDRTLFDGVDISIPGLARFAGGRPSAPLVSALAGIAGQVQTAQQAFAREGPGAVSAPLAAGLAALRSLRGGLEGLELDEAARFEIDFRLKTEEAEFEEALVLAHALRFDALSDDGLVVTGQPVQVRLSLANRGGHAVEVTSVAFDGFEGDAGCRVGAVDAGAVYRCDAALAVSGRVPLSTPYWTRIPGTARYAFEPDVPFGVPHRPTPFVARVGLTVSGAALTVGLPVLYRYEGDIFSGEKRMRVQVVPRFSVDLTPAVAIVPSAADPGAGPGSGAPAPGEGERELRVTVVNGGRGAARATVGLVVPAGWRAVPEKAEVAFERQDQASTVRFRVAPPPGGAPPGAYTIGAVVRAGDETFDRGYRVVEYPHVERQHWVEPAVTTVKVVDVEVAPDLNVGYVMGVGDQVPRAIEQLGARVDLLEADALAWGDLSRYDAIVTGVRAYERRADLRAHNHRLLEYAEAGGAVIVQYNKFEFNEAQYGPYPAKVSSNRVTAEDAPVIVVRPEHPLFTWPNRLGDASWSGWVQERGLYFLGEKDSRYVDLVEMEDPFEFNRGVKRGALVEARIGAGRWIYVGLGLWRQLPAGTDGAYRILANLISLRRAVDAR